MNFYGFDPSYHIARHRFVHRTPLAWTPLHLARHRRTAAWSAALDGRASSAIGRAPKRRTALQDRRPRAGRRLPALRLRLACRHELCGWVRNRSGEVEIHAEGPAERLGLFAHALLSRAPPAAAPRMLEVCAAPLERRPGFQILASTLADELEVHLPLDLFTCDECLVELGDGGVGATAILSSTARSAVLAIR